MCLYFFSSAAGVYFLLELLYGAYHQRRFKRKEDARRAEELRLKPMRDAKLAEEKKAALIGSTALDCIHKYKNVLRVLIRIINLNICQI